VLILFKSVNKYNFELVVDTLNEFLFSKNANLLEKLKSPKTKEYEMKLKDYEIVLPKFISELHDWGDSLHNCLAAYADMVQKNITKIFAFKKH